MKKILGLSVAALLVIAMVGGGTWAFFQDTENVGGNSITAGTLDLVADGAAGLFSADVTDAYPGLIGSAKVTLSNSGNLDGNLSIQDTAITNTGSVGLTEFVDGSGDLGAAGYMALYVDYDQVNGWSSGDKGLKSDGTTYTFAADVTGTADSGSTTTLVDDALTDADDAFNGMLLTITGGTASGETRIISDFDAANDTITVLSPFSVALDNTSVYSISNLLYATIDSYNTVDWNDVTAPMDEADTDDFIVYWRIPGIVDNTIQGDSVEIEFTILLEQANES